MTQPTFPATADGFHDALTRSQRRRTRRHALAASASGTALAVVAVAVLAGQPGSPDSLRQQRPIGPAEGASASPATTAPPAPVQVSPRSRAPEQPAASALALPPPLTRPDDPGATGSGDQLPEQSRESPPISTPARLTTTSYRPGSPCADTSGRAATGWCLQPDAPRSGISGRPVELRVSLCRLPGFGSAAASFPTTAEAGYALDAPSGGPRVWEHAAQHAPRPGRHERRVAAGDCLTWATTWTNRSDDGQPVPAGSYELELSVLADNTSGANTVVTQTYAYRVE